MNVLVLEEVSMMNVSVKVGFDVFSGREDLPKLFGVLKAAGEVNRITPESGIVMGKEERRLVGVLIEQLRQPHELFPTE